MTVNTCIHDYLYQALDSLRDQTLADFELIFYSKNKADAALVNEYCLLHDIHGECLWAESSTDRADRFSRAVTHCQGEWIINLDHDDILHPDALWTVYRCLRRFPSINFFCGAHKVFDMVTRGRGENPSNPYAQTLDSLIHAFKQRHLWGFRNDSTRWPPDLFESKYPVEDYWFFACLSLNAIAVLHIPHYLYAWRSHPAQWSKFHLNWCKDMSESIQCRLRFHSKKKSAMWHWGDLALATRMAANSVSLSNEIAIGGDG